MSACGSQVIYNSKSIKVSLVTIQYAWTGVVLIYVYFWQMAGGHMLATSYLPTEASSIFPDRSRVMYRPV
jgi:hypothetical protein